MDTLQLKAFLAVAQHRSFTLAADALHLTQPAVSKRISSLEEQLHCRLFDRINRRVALTPSGKALMPRAQRILREMQNTETELANLKTRISGRLSIITSHHIGLHHLPKVLKDYQRHFPEVSLDLEFLDSDNAYDAIESGAAELAVITLSDILHPDIISTPLWRDPLSLVISAQHPLAKAQEVSLRELNQFTNILPDRNSRTGHLVQSLFSVNNLALRDGMTTNYLETIKMMVSIGLGWGILPDTLLDDSLKVVTPSDLTLERELGVIQHRNRTLSNAGGAFLTTLHSYAG